MSQIPYRTSSIPDRIFPSGWLWYLVFDILWHVKCWRVSHHFIQGCYCLHFVKYCCYCYYSTSHWISWLVFWDLDIQFLLLIQRICSKHSSLHKLIGKIWLRISEVGWSHWMLVFSELLLVANLWIYAINCMNLSCSWFPFWCSSSHCLLACSTSSEVAALFRILTFHPTKYSNAARLTMILSRSSLT